MFTDLNAKVSQYFKGMLTDSSPSEKLTTGGIPPSIKKQQDMVNSHHLSDLLPYEFYDEENDLFFTEEAYGFGYSILPSVGMDETTVTNLSNLFSHGMKKGIIIQVTLVSSPNVMPKLTKWADARIHEGDPDERSGRKSGVYRTLARKRVEYLMGGCWHSLFSDQVMMVRDYEIVFTLMVPKLRNTIELNDLELSEIKRLRNATMGGLESSGIQLTPLTESYFVNFLHSIINPSLVRREQVELDSTLAMNEQVVDESTGLYVGRDSLALTTKGVDTDEFVLDVRSYKVKSFPKAWAAWNNSSLLGHPTDNNRRIPAHFMVTLTIAYPDQLNQIAHAKTKSMRAGQMARNMGDLVPSWAQKKSDWAFVVDKLEEGHTMALMNYQVTLFSPVEKADYAEHQLVSVYKSAGFRIVRERFVALHALLNALPMGATPSLVKDAIKLKRFKTLLTWSAANLAPFIGEWKGTQSPFLQLLGRRGQLLQVDPLDNDQGNYNIAIAAASGSGKSVLGQELVKNTLELGGRVWLFDRGRSFQNLSKMLNGEYLVFAMGKGISINPFSNVKSWLGDDTVGSERIMIRDMIVQMASFKGALQGHQVGWIEQALQTAWETEGHDAEITTVYDILQADVGENRRDKTRLADSFYSFTKNGSQGEFFTGESNVDLSNDFVGLEMQELDSMPELQGVVVLMLILKITQEFYNQGERQRRKMCLIDEAWKLMRGNAGEFIEEGYRTARKFSGSFVTITQGVNEYYQNPVTQACWENSDWKFLLRQNEDSLRFLKQQNRLPGGDGTFKLLESLETRHGYYSEVAILSPAGMTTGRLVIDPFSEKLFTTKGAEFATILQLQKDGMSIEEAIDTVVKRSGKR